MGDPLMNTDKPNYKKARRPSVSVTDLVAQIAGQIAHEQVQKLEDELMEKLNKFELSRQSKTYESLIADIEQLRKQLRDTNNEFRNHRIAHAKNADTARVENSLQRLGFVWPAEEDKQLREELITALNTIAANHGRSAHGIRCRIQDKNLLKEVSF
jgi:hypothetical protein